MGGKCSRLPTHSGEEYFGSCNLQGCQTRRWTRPAPTCRMEGRRWWVLKQRYACVSLRGLHGQTHTARPIDAPTACTGCRARVWICLWTFVAALFLAQPSALGFIFYSNLHQPKLVKVRHEGYLSSPLTPIHNFCNVTATLVFTHLPPH